LYFCPPPQKSTFLTIFGGFFDFLGFSGFCHFWPPPQK
jgi:hypothetical protein